MALRSFNQSFLFTRQLGLPAADWLCQHNSTLDLSFSTSQKIETTKSPFSKKMIRLFWHKWQKMRYHFDKKQK